MSSLRLHPTFLKVVTAIWRYTLKLNFIQFEHIPIRIWKQKVISMTSHELQYRIILDKSYHQMCLCRFQIIIELRPTSHGRCFLEMDHFCTLKVKYWVLGIIATQFCAQNYSNTRWQDAYNVYCRRGGERVVTFSRPAMLWAMLFHFY